MACFPENLLAISFNKTYKELWLNTDLLKNLNYTIIYWYTK